jgi:hypothetical protein
MSVRAPLFLSVLLAACGLQLTSGSTNTVLPDAAAPDAAREMDAGVTAPDSASDAGTMLPTDPGPPDCRVGGGVSSPFAAKSRLANAAALVVDGEAGDWSRASEWASIAKALGDAPKDAAVCAQFTAAWDEEALYVLVRVADTNHPQPVTGPDEDKIWLNDAVDVFWGPAGLAASGAYRGADHRLVVDHRGKGWLRNGDGAGGVTERPFSNGDTLQFATRSFSWGYTTEVKITRAAFGSGHPPFTSGMQLPFMVGFSEQSTQVGNPPSHHYLWQLDQTRDVTCSMSEPLPPSLCCTRPSSPDFLVAPGCNTRLFELVRLVP